MQTFTATWIDRRLAVWTNCFFGVDGHSAAPPPREFKPSPAREAVKKRRAARKARP